MRDQNGVTALKLWSSESLSPGGSSGVGTHALVKIAATSRTKAPILPQQVTNVVSKLMQYGGPTPSVSSPGGMRPYAFARTRYFSFFYFFPALIVHKLPSPAPYTTYTHTSCFKKAAAPCNQTQNGHNVLRRCCNHQHRPVLHKLLSGSCNSSWNKLRHMHSDCGTCTKPQAPSQHCHKGLHIFGAYDNTERTCKGKHVNSVETLGFSNEHITWQICTL